MASLSSTSMSHSMDALTVWDNWVDPHRVGGWRAIWGKVKGPVKLLYWASGISGVLSVSGPSLKVESSVVYEMMLRRVRWIFRRSWSGFDSR